MGLEVIVGYRDMMEKQMHNEMEILVLLSRE